ncbi:hypothetical protein GCM10011515_05750 [Tsuneonella deserti]|uniref:Cytochrome b561 bacterial/Ni-hydrogenase domain-containing protein n=1 Tax=Tsuneonella deserti TaxID=2035528 RepID=A0ABQ1S469_9SPHN|nr:cytochrome b [Tsuneonella deserti]GGD88941.1 hypothetical protein GCM10011515_05750 [Tsuneonella deserti]
MQAERGPRYSGVAMLLHWLIAVAVIVNWQLAENARDGDNLMQLHAATGITILALTVLRILWRLVHRPPPLAPTLHRWERVLAHVTHAVFYILLIALPLLGWIGYSVEGKGIDVFGLLRVGALPVQQGGHDAAEGVFEIHETLGSAMIYLIGLHIVGALKHTLWDKDGNLWRMLPFGTPKA